MSRILNNIQFRLMVLVSCVVLVVSIASLYMLYNYANNFIINRASEITSLTLRNYSENLDYFFDEVYDVALRLQTEDLPPVISDQLWESESRQQVDAIHEILMNEVDKHPFIEGIHLYLPGDDTVVTSDGIGYIHRGISSYETQVWAAYDHDAADKSLYEIVSYRDQLSLFQHDYLAVIKPIKDEDGKLLGQVMVGIREVTVYDEVINAFNVSEDEFIYLLDHQQNILSSNAQEMLNNDLLTTLEAFRQYKEGYFYHSLDGEESIIVYNNSALASYSLVYEIPIQVMSRGINVLKRIALVLMFAAVTAAVLILYFILKSFIQPIFVIKRSMKLFALGELDTRIREVRKDEFNVLYEGFNRMAEEVETLIDKTVAQRIKINRSQYMTLQTQISPHFVYNTLYSIKCMALVEENPVTAEMLASFIELLQASADNSKDLIPLKDELNLVSQYVKLQKNRFGDSFRLEFDMPDSALYHNVPKLVLQPLVENCLKYGIDLKDGHGIIRISAIENDDELIVCVYDNGSNSDMARIKEILATDSPDRQNEIGIINVNQRIKLIYGPDYGLSYRQDDHRGLTAEVHIAYEPSTEYKWIR